jgi:hypothetical protein
VRVRSLPFLYQSTGILPNYAEHAFQYLDHEPSIVTLLHLSVLKFDQVDKLFCAAPAVRLIAAKANPTEIAQAGGLPGRDARCEVFEVLVVPRDDDRTHLVPDARDNRIGRAAEEELADEVDLVASLAKEFRDGVRDVLVR